MSRLCGELHALFNQIFGPSSFHTKLAREANNLDLWLSNGSKHAPSRLGAGNWRTRTLQGWKFIANTLATVRWSSSLLVTDISGSKRRSTGSLIAMRSSHNPVRCSNDINHQSLLISRVVVGVQWQPQDVLN